MNETRGIDRDRGSTLRDYLQTVRRGWWLIALNVAIVTLSAVYFSTIQEKLYEASSEVLVQSLDTSDPDRALQTLADLASVSPVVGESVQEALALEATPAIEVTPRVDSNILTFISTEPDSGLAARVATEYAEQFADFQRDLVTADVERELARVESEIRRIQSIPPARRDQTLYAEFLDRREELRAIQRLESRRTLVVRPASPGVQVQPNVVRNGVFGFVLGLIIGLGLAFARQALDTRAHSTDDVGERLGLPLLAMIPGPPRRLRNEKRLALISEPDGQVAAAFRVLSANVDFAQIGPNGRTLLVTSGVAGEGKSTTVANLAVALARSGQHVALVDLDLRKPSIDEFFDLKGPGITEVAGGRVSLDQALVPIPLVWPGGGALNGSTGDARPTGGMLEVLPAGAPPANIDDVLSKHIVAPVLEQLRGRADLVLVDSSPLLVGETMALAAAVDAMLLVVRMETVTHPMLRQVRWVLDAVPARKIGFVATGRGSDDLYHAYGTQAGTTTRVREPIA